MTTVAVIGGGVVGVTSAYYLRQRGFQVTVFERNEEVARETSFGNAGLIAPAYVAPWAQPGMPAKVLSYLFSADAPVRIRPRLDLGQWRWLARAVGECRLDRFRRNKSRLLRLALHSRTRLHELRARHVIEDRRCQGYLQLYRSDTERARAAPSRALLAEAGIAHQPLTAGECRQLEPALAPGPPLAGGLFLPDDEAGDCAHFTVRLKEVCLSEGVHFELRTTVESLTTDGHRITALQTSGGPRSPAAVLIAAGVDSTHLLAPLGLSLPLYPVKGYSLTAAITRPDRAPRLAIMDEAYKVAITPMGDRLRIAGTAEIGSRALTPHPGALRTLARIAHAWFPDAATYTDARPWTGARPMLPDGPPILGPTRYPNLFLNIGHGGSGWALSCGSAHVVADMLAGLPPAIDTEGLTVDRYLR